MPAPEKPVKPQLPAEVRKIFTDAVTAFPGDFAKQAQHIVRAQRPAGLPEHFQPLNMSLSDWDRIQRERERQRQEAEAQAREQQRQAELREQQRRAGETAEMQLARQLNEQKRRQAQAIGEQTCQQLEQEVRNYPNQFDQLAERIANTWRQRSQGTSVSVTPFRHPSVLLNDDGTIQDDASAVGMKVSHSYEEPHEYWETHNPGDYEYRTRETYTVKKELTLGFGIGYFDEWSSEWAIPPEAQRAIHGRVKAYCIDATAKNSKKTLIPTNYPGGLGIFLERLYDISESLSSELMILNPPPRQTRPTEPQPRPQKRGFWRRLFGGW